MEMELNGILLATDGSEDAALAARAAVDLSKRTGADLHLVHVWSEATPMAYPSMSAAVDRHGGGDRARELLEAETEKVERAGGTVAKAHLRRGRPADEIIGLSEEVDADLVVVGSRGAGLVKRLVIGSVSEGVVYLASRPTLVVRGGKDAWPPRTVVLGDDSSEEAGKAGDFAAFLGGLFGASAVLMQAFHHHSLTRAPGRTPRASGQTLEAADERLAARAEALERPLGTRPESVVEVGDAASIIQRVADERGAGTLVAVGSRGSGAAQRFALGSVSTDVLRAVDGPVLVCPTPGDGEDARDVRV